MLQTPIPLPETADTRIAETPRDWLARYGGDAPVLLACPEALSARHDRFRHGFPGEVTYAVKANPDPGVIGQFAAGGMRGFDVASPAEMTLLRNRGRGGFVVGVRHGRTRQALSLRRGAGRGGRGAGEAAGGGGCL